MEGAAQHIMARLTRINWYRYAVLYPLHVVHYLVMIYTLCAVIAALHSPIFLLAFIIGGAVTGTWEWACFWISIGSIFGTILGAALLMGFGFISDEFI